MKQYRFKIGIESNVAWFKNDEQALDFANFIGANCERDTAIFRLKQDNKFCSFELEIENTELIRNLEFKNVNIWEV